MRDLRTRSLELALLLALFLPLQGFAAAWSCEPLHAQPHCPHGLAAVQHHGCGTCCLAAIAAAPLRFALPPLRSDVSFPQPSTQLTVALDRLDRPPRAT
jgi:hypothetical protein